MQACEDSMRQDLCDLCRGREFDLVARSDRLSQPLNTVICRRCGLISHESIPTDAELDEYYRNEYRRDYHGEFEPSPHRIVRAWEGAQSLLKKVLPYTAPGSRVFEVGAGIGCTVKAFEKLGFRSSGIEPGIGFQQFAQEQLQADVQRKRLQDLPAEPRYDLVLLIHVIEHFNSPRRALEKIRSILRPGGRLYVECPNVGAPHAAPSKLYHAAHVYNFAPETLIAMAESCGYRVHTQLSGPENRELRFLLQNDAAPRLQLKPYVCDVIKKRLARYTDTTYHLRPAYLIHRLVRKCRLASHHLMAKTRVRRLIGSEQRRVAAGQA